MEKALRNIFLVISAQFFNNGEKFILGQENKGSGVHFGQ